MLALILNLIVSVSVRMDNISKMGSGLASVLFICSLDRKFKNQELKQTSSV